MNQPVPEHKPTCLCSQDLTDAAGRIVLSRFDEVPLVAKGLL